MSLNEEQERIIENLDELIKLAKLVSDYSAFGTEDQYEMANEALQAQRKRILAMDGIEL